MVSGVTRMFPIDCLECTMREIAVVIAALRITNSFLWVRALSTMTRDRNLQFRGAISIGFLKNFSKGFFPFLPRFLCNLVRKSAPKCGEIDRFLGGEIRRILSRLCHDFFLGPLCLASTLQKSMPNREEGNIRQLVRWSRCLYLYVYIYIYICCRVKNWSNFCLF